MKNLTPILLLAIPAILLLREFFCWYFKINVIIKQNEQILENMGRIQILLGDQKIKSAMKEKQMNNLINSIST
jgi:hypothetical protein